MEGDRATMLPALPWHSSGGELQSDRHRQAISAVHGRRMYDNTITVNTRPESDFGFVRNIGFGNGRSLSKGIIDGKRGIKYGSGGLDLYDNGGFSIEDEITIGAVGEVMPWKSSSFTDLAGKVEVEKDSNIGANGGGPVKGRRTSDLEIMMGGVSTKDFNAAYNTERRGVDGRFNMPSLQYNLDSNERGEDKEKEGTLSRYGHSGSDDLMNKYVSGINYANDACFPINFQYCQEADEGNEDPLRISSSVAFGSDDWDDFEYGNAGRVTNSLSTEVLRAKEEHGQKSSYWTLTGSLSNSKPKPENKTLAASTEVRDDMERKESGIGNSLAQVFPIGTLSELTEEARDINMSSYRVLAATGFTERGRDPFPTEAVNVCKSEEKDSKDIAVISNQIQETCNLRSVKGFPVGSVAEMQIAEGADKAHSEKPASFTDCLMEKPLECMKPEEVIGIDDSEVADNERPAKSEANQDPLSITETDNLELNGLCDEIVHDMEEILLDSAESPLARFSHESKVLLPLRDGGSTASTSVTDKAFPFVHKIRRIERIAVVGARQKTGDVSFGERLVGVKEYTVYEIRVWSGLDQWEIERRYRDFYSFYRQLKTIFSDKGWTLPSPWSSVEKESIKIFGSSSPDIVAERSVIIEECLSSILHSSVFPSLPRALIWFFSPRESSPGSPASRLLVSHLSTDKETFTTLGKTISLFVEIPPYKTTRQILEEQHYSCAGCHAHFDDGRTLLQDLVQTLGWGKPRLCEYTSQLFCFLCHLNDTAIIPARILHHWDFTQYPVSQLAKSYLDSIYDQPMLCVSAVNPFLCSKVPALLHVMGIRKRIGTMLRYIHCPFRKSIITGLGPRYYLLESTDFFAVKDLLDLSKGAFAALPAMLETVSRRILEHITEQCLICCDVGVPCRAGKFCCDPASLIFPFQDCEVDKCAFCDSIFHKPCFKMLTHCPCRGELLMDRHSGAS